MNRNALKAKTAWVQSRAFARPVNQVALASGEEGRRKITCARISFTFGDLGRVFFERRQTQREKTKVSTSEKIARLRRSLGIIRKPSTFRAIVSSDAYPWPFESGEEHRVLARRWTSPSNIYTVRIRRRTSQAGPTLDAISSASPSPFEFDEEHRHPAPCRARRSYVHTPIARTRRSTSIRRRVPLA